MRNMSDQPVGTRVSRRRPGASQQRPRGTHQRPWATAASLVNLICWACALTPAPILAQDGSNVTDPALAERIEMATEWTKQFEGRIPGSRLSSPEDVEYVRNSLHCLAHNGRWVLNPVPRRIPWHYNGLDICDERWMKAHPTSGVAGPAADRVQNASEWNIRPGLKYEWQASEECGIWEQFDPGYFCLLMRKMRAPAMKEGSLLRKLGAPLLIVGDSLSKSMIESLSNQLQIREESKTGLFKPRVCKDWESSNELDPGRGACIGIKMCKAPILHVRNDKLTLAERLHIDVKLLEAGKKQIEYYLPWLTLIRTWGIRAVVLNRGAHFTRTEEFEKELETSMMILRKKYPNLLILYRATAPGHKKCEEIEIPLQFPQEGADLPYHWGSMQEQNVAAKRIVEKYGGVFLDIEPMMSLRGDGHRGFVDTLAGRIHDCLHYCNPGPVEVWNRLLQNALSRLL